LFSTDYRTPQMFGSKRAKATALLEPTAQPTHDMAAVCLKDLVTAASDIAPGSRSTDAATVRLPRHATAGDECTGDQYEGK
jgi:hypothetical protein